MNRNNNNQWRKSSSQSSADSSSGSHSNNNSPNNPRYRSTNPTTTKSSGPNSTWKQNHSTPMSTHQSNNLPLEKQEEDCSDSHTIVGTCPFMCPEKERSQREQLRDLAVFERLDGNPRRTSPSLAVKKFCRTISTKEVQPSDLRPLAVLEDTLDYLMKFLDLSDQPFEVVHDFIFDRTRSIRQDLSMQSISNVRVICMYEKIVKFHVISHHKLRRCEGDSTTISSIHHLNAEQLTKCLASLYYFYDVNRTSDSIFDNEAEFRSLYVLHHLDSQSGSTGESLSLWFSRLPAFIFKVKEMCFARRVLRFYRIGNFWRFFHSVASEATHLQFCVIEPFIKEVRLHAIACINSSGYKLHPYPMASLSKILMIKEVDLDAFCNACGLQTFQDDIGNKVLPTKQSGFSHPKGGIHCHDFSQLDLLKVDAYRSARSL